MIVISEEEIIGVIYPLRENNFNLLKQRKDPVYVKFLSHNSKNPTKLHQGNIMLFYISRKNKSIVGYSKIREISYKNSSEIKEQYMDRIQMKEKEFNKYIINRENKPLMFLELDEIVKFEEESIVNHPITMTGTYISTNELGKYTILSNKLFKS